MNFGGIGVVIGHEMTHGFDDQGSQYDGKGNLREWQTEADRKAFTERTECVAKEYDGFEAAPAKAKPRHSISMDTLLWAKTPPTMAACASPTWRCSIPWQQEGKTIDDKIDDYTEAQRYFIGFAQVWCQNQTERPRASARWSIPIRRASGAINGSVQNFDEFGKAFGCTKGTPMYPRTPAEFGKNRTRKAAALLNVRRGYFLRGTSLQMMPYRSATTTGPGAPFGEDRYPVTVFLALTLLTTISNNMGSLPLKN